MRLLYFFLFVVIFSYNSVAQVTAQGQGGKLVSWNAVSFEQSIGKKFTNKNVIAYSSKSFDDSWNPFAISGIFTVREELEYKLSRRFKVSHGMFYAQRFYVDDSHPDYINEIRVYPKLYHQFNVGRIRFSQYLRADFRLFAAPGFKRWHKPFEFRARYLMKMTVPIDKNDNKFIVFITELLAATDEEVDVQNRKSFTQFCFTENRSSLFYRHHIHKPDMFFDLGIMNQMWRSTTDKNFNQTLILQLDWVFENIFKR